MKRRFLSLLPLAILVLEGCSDGEQPVPPPPEVTVLKVQPGTVAIADELPGRVVAYRIAEIRPQVSGIIQRRFFDQGAEVRAGQPLFQINPAPFRADSDSAAATLQRAQATYARAKVQADRLHPLVEADAISRQSYDDAVVARDQAIADVAQARAAHNRRRLDVSFARIAAPISGKIGQALITEGALVGPSDVNPLATVQQIDQVYVDVRQPTARMDALREAVERGTTDRNAPVEILSSDGTAYPEKGRLLFSDITVDAGTGDAIVRVLVPNAQRRLLPGMFVRARLPRSTQRNAIAVPQQSVHRDPSGAAHVAMVDAKGQVKMQPVTVGDVVDGRYVVLTGLHGGEDIVVEGYERIQPNAPVKAVAWKPAGGKAD